MTEPHFHTATTLTGMLRRREIGAGELLEHLVERVERHNPALNAIIWTDIERARRDARRADEALARGDVLGPLHGLPMTIKESYGVEGAPTTWGDPALVDNIAGADSLPVARFRAAGAVLFGKSNVPLMLADWQSYNAVYGTTNNPWDLTRSPGGSSGGSAAALAAGLTGLEAGSDIGASIRNPAHYCGVYGHKPTWGIVSGQGHALPGGHTPFGDISVVGPLARGASDLGLALDVMRGLDDLDGQGLRVELPAPRHAALKDFRVAVIHDDPNSAVDAAITDRMRALVSHLRQAGATVSETARPDIDLDRLAEVYILLLRAATSTRTDPALIAEAERNPQKYAGDQSFHGRMMRALALRHREWLVLNNERHAMRRAFADFFRSWDVLLCPVAASAAFPHDQSGDRWDRTITVNGEQVPTTDQMFWAGISGVVYLPGTAAPIGYSPEGLPVGVQIVGPHMGDRTTIAFAELLEREFFAFEPPPGY